MCIGLGGRQPVVGCEHTAGMGEGHGSGALHGAHELDGGKPVVGHKHTIRGGRSGYQQCASPCPPVLPHASSRLDCPDAMPGHFRMGLLPSATRHTALLLARHPYRVHAAPLNPPVYGPAAPVFPTAQPCSQHTTYDSRPCFTPPSLGIDPPVYGPAAPQLPHHIILQLPGKGGDALGGTRTLPYGGPCGNGAGAARGCREENGTVGGG